MSTFGGAALTLSDMKKRLNPDGSTAFIIEALEKSNPIIQDVLWVEGNMKTGNMTTVRTSIPKPKVRLINRGVTPGKSTTKQIQDTCMILEDKSKIDVEEIALQNDKIKYRDGENAAFSQGMANMVADTMFYGDSENDPGTFNGLSVRYNTTIGDKGTAGYQTVSAGTAGTNTNTSAFFTGWGERGTIGIYPQNTVAGLKMRDLGEQTAFDTDKGEFQALCTLFNWKCGLAVQNIRFNSVLRNIDVSKLATLTSAQKLDLMNKLVITKNRIINLDNGDKKVKLYVSDSMYDFFDTYLIDKNNVFVTQQTLADKSPKLYFKGIEVLKCESISETESACATA